MNGNIFNYSLASEEYNWNGGSAYAIPPMPPGIVFCPLTGECEPIFTQSYINAYNTAFNQETKGFSENYQRALNKYKLFTFSDVSSNFIPGTFGYDEENNTLSQSFYINYLQDDVKCICWNSLSICFSGFWRRVRIYVLKLDNSYLWGALCCECIIKIYC